MHLHETGAERRPKLGLSFGDKPLSKQQRASATLTSLELRRLVAEMID